MTSFRHNMYQGWYNPESEQVTKMTETKTNYNWFQTQYALRLVQPICEQKYENLFFARLKVSIQCITWYISCEESVPLELYLAGKCHQLLLRVSAQRPNHSLGLPGSRVTLCKIGKLPRCLQVVSLGTDKVQHSNIMAMWTELG